MSGIFVGSIVPFSLTTYETSDRKNHHEFGGLDILVNNAALQWAEQESLKI